MEEIKKILVAICEAYKLGALKSWGEIESDIKKYRKVIFETEEGKEYTYFILKN